MDLDLLKALPPAHRVVSIYRAAELFQTEFDVDQA